MASGIPVFYVQQFSANIQLKLQQQGSRLRAAVMSGSHVGSQASPVDQFGAVNANKVTGRYNPMPRTDAPADRRWVSPQDYDINQLLDTFDELRLLVNPTAAYVENATYALGRAIDSEIISGLTGSNFVGNAGTTSVSLPASQIVLVAQGAASPVNLTVAKLRAARKILRTNEVDFDKDKIYTAITATNEDTLLSEVQVVSTEFNDKPVLVEGRLMRFLGIDMIHTELLQTGTDDQSGTSTAVPVWAKSGSYLGMWNDIQTKVSQRDDLQSIPYQAYAKGTFGGTRLEEKKVVQIWTR